MNKNTIVANFSTSYADSFKAQVDRLDHSDSILGFEAQVNSFPGEDACNFLDLLVFGNEKNVFFFVSGEDYEGYATEKDTNLPEILEEFQEWIGHSDNKVTEEMLKSAYPIAEFTTEEVVDQLRELITSVIDA